MKQKLFYLLTDSPGIVAGMAAASVIALAGCPPPVEPVTTVNPAPTTDAKPPSASTAAAAAAPEAKTAVLVKPMALYDAAKPNLNVLLAKTTDCPPYKQHVLEEPTRIRPKDGVVGTHLIVAMKPRCVPVYVTKTSTGKPVTPAVWTMQKMTLRSYGFPKDPAAPIKIPTSPTAAFDLEDPSILWSSPGPTFELRKGSKDGKVTGTKFRMTLLNAMPGTIDGKPIDFHACNTLEKLAQPDATPPGAQQGPFPPNKPEQVPPNCFHGDNSTNFHMHGSHVSPQEHQDYVGLELLPWGSDAKTHHATHGKHGITAVGNYDYDVDPIRYDQAEGTHWYHAHKHGSTALQVLNGLSGAFIIRGEFDDKLGEYFKQGGNDLADHVLVVQQIREKQPGLGGGEPPAVPLVNGQGNPIIQMKPGEIQRWRFIGATQNAGAQFKVDLPDGFTYAQIALDGVQFSPENYVCQPLLAGVSTTCVPKPTSLPTTSRVNSKEPELTIGPATRIDLLVQAPAKAGIHTSSFIAPPLELERLDGPGVATPQKLRQLAASAPSPVKGVLLTVEVVGTPVKMTLPTMQQFPPMPDFLTNIKPPEVKRTVAYQLANQGELGKADFHIDGVKFNPECGNQTLKLGVAEEWKLTNNSGIAHPFHIHTNPFQLIELQEWTQTAVDANKNPTGPFKSVLTKYPYPIWRDTIPIPTVNGDDATKLGYAIIRYLPVNFTGTFVHHCHILGHEDRGMMHNTQVICPGGNLNDYKTWKFGKPSATIEECTGEVSSATVLPPCGATTP